MTDGKIQAATILRADPASRLAGATAPLSNVFFGVNGIYASLTVRKFGTLNPSVGTCR
jgi:hypothetical protein